MLVVRLFAFLLVFLVQNQVKKEETGLFDLRGKAAMFPPVQAVEGTVIWFFSPECPLCENYTLAIRELQEKYRGSFRFVGICPLEQINANQIEAFLQKYKLKLEVYRDPNKQFTQKLGARVTPEVFIINKKGKTVYSGRIDNWAYAPGKTRQFVSSHELKETLEKLKKNQNLNYSHQPAIGCFIE